MGKIGDLWVKLGLKKEEYDKGMDDAHRRAASFGDKIGRVSAAAAAAWVAIGAAVTKFAKSCVKAYEVQEASVKKLNNALRNTEGQLGLNSEQLQRYASELQTVSTFGDEATLSAMATLTTFKSVTGEVFKATIKAAQDMAAFMGTDLNSAVMQLGKALESPEQGLTMLRRSGVVFSQEMIDQIKTLTREGRTAEAQMLTLAEVEKRFGGAAAADADTVAGAWRQVANAFGDVAEAIGGSAAKANGLAKWLTKSLGAMSMIASDSSLNFGQKLGVLFGGRGKKTAYAEQMLEQQKNADALAASLNAMNAALEDYYGIDDDKGKGKGNGGGDTKDPMLEKIRQESSELAEIAEYDREMARQAVESYNAMTEDKVSAYYAAMQQITSFMDEYNNEADSFNAKEAERLRELRDMYEDTAQKIGDAIRGGMVSALDELAAAIGTGDWDTSALVKAFVTPIADAAISTGVLIMSTGKGIEALKEAFINAFGSGPYAAIAAGAALVGIGVAAKAGLAAIASGSKSTASTTTSSYSGGSTAASSQTVESELTVYVEGKISGKDILLAGQRTQKGWGR